MKNRKMLLQVLFAMTVVIGLTIPALVAGASGGGFLSDKRPASYSAADSCGVFSAMPLNTPQGNIAPMVAAGDSHIVRLKSDGTVVAVGDKSYGQYDVNGWNLN